MSDTLSVMRIELQWNPRCWHFYMAKPDTPNFSLGARVIVGLIAILVIAAMLHFFGYF
jgi:hypothetical protein